MRTLIPANLNGFTVPRLENFTPFSSTAIYFRDTGDFETSAPNEPKMTLNTKRPKVLHMHITTTPPPQPMSRGFALQPPAFELLAILRQIQQMTLK